MEKQSELESKYQKLATEYSKVRSQATVLKKAVLDEQAKGSELKDIIRKHEQTIRKHNQEMESLTFRNEQLTKRILVLQQDLQINSHVKKGKQKSTTENIHVMDVSVFNEEFQKKILENAQLLSSLSDKEIEINSYKERIEWLEEKVSNLEKDLDNKEEKYKDKIFQLQKEKDSLTNKLKELNLKETERRNSLNENDEKVVYWKVQADKWMSECELLRKKPTTNEELTEYYESQLRKMLELKTVALSETKSLSAENQALKARLENVILEHAEIQNKLETNYEELITTNENYRTQLDAMTEHLAAQNEKITKQFDEIQMLKHKLSVKK